MDHALRKTLNQGNEQEKDSSEKNRVKKGASISGWIDDFRDVHFWIL